MSFSPVTDYDYIFFWVHELSKCACGGRGRATAQSPHWQLEARFWPESWPLPSVKCGTLSCVDREVRNRISGSPNAQRWTLKKSLATVTHRACMCVFVFAFIEWTLLCPVAVCWCACVFESCGQVKPMRVRVWVCLERRRLTWWRHRAALRLSDGPPTHRRTAIHM